MSCSIKLKEVRLNFPLYANKDPNTKSLIIDFLKRRKSKENEKKYFLALDNINLEFNENEVIGLVGRNGAGKSTLIRVMSEIYKPNSGICEINGKVVTLMGMGVGFNANLDAIENIKVSGLIMGMDKDEIKERTHSILEFAELHDFSNLPIKYYSTGMKTRLGFSAATEINPEILMLDEVFSGGDAHWLEKANVRMRRIINESKIVVIVSHSTGRIKDLCNRVVWLDKGKIKADGETNQIMDEYLKK